VSGRVYQHGVTKKGGDDSLALYVCLCEVCSTLFWAKQCGMQNRSSSGPLVRSLVDASKG
jgi:hypothetical protein